MSCTVQESGRTFEFSSSPSSLDGSFNVHTWSWFPLSSCGLSCKTQDSSFSSFYSFSSPSSLFEFLVTTHIGSFPNSSAPPSSLPDGTIQPFTVLSILLSWFRSKAPLLVSRFPFLTSFERDGVVKSRICRPSLIKYSLLTLCGSEKWFGARWKLVAKKLDRSDLSLTFCTSMVSVSWPLSFS